MPLSSPEDVCNQALAALGSKLLIGDIYEGSLQSRAFLEIYSETRDEVMRLGEWAFTNGFAPLTLLKGPPPPGGYSPTYPWSSVYPKPGYLYEYAYPADGLDLRNVIKQPAQIPVLDPKSVPFRVENDPTPIISTMNPPVTTGPPQKVVFCNTANAFAIYVRRVTNPLLWEPGFIATFVAALAKKASSSPLIAASAEMMKTLPGETAATGQFAMRHQG